jgi:predicted dehydrogenase/NADPH:quinone reductase-like Zn-dependent oxidoreductase
MKQIIQDLSSGETRMVDTPRPSPKAGSLVIDSRQSLVSVGTERMLVDFGKASLISKARQQPDKVKQVLDKVRTDGLFTTFDAVKSKLGQPIPLGYSNVGIVADTGGVSDFSVGDRVVSNGPHAETVRVSKNLCVRIPDTVTDEAATFAVVGSIGLQGVRLVNPTIGEAVVVIGTGLIGLMTVQILLANGCRVLAMDYDQAKLDLAQQYGAEICNLADGADPVEAGMIFSGRRGADAVIITASTKSNDPIENAALMSRKRGRIVLVGVTSLNLSRDNFYEKELSFQVSCSYGPGRYDPAYEESGNDYPLGFVRWTEKRNFETILDLMASGKIDVSRMVSKQLAFEDAPAAFQALGDDKNLLGLLLSYGRADEDRQQRTVELRESNRNHTADGKPQIAVIGAGNYASRILIPALSKINANLGPVVTSAGLSGTLAGAQNNVLQSSTDIDMILSNEDIAAAVVATQHNSHAALTIQLLRAGKDVFVEKPLAITHQQLADVREAYATASTKAGGPRLMVGYNRRFSHYITEMKALLDRVSAPKTFIMTMNAGAIPADVWIQKTDVGGGRIIGEACHHIDLMRFLTGHKIVEIKAQKMGYNQTENITEDKAIILLRFADGSHGSIHYLANGSSSFPKERIEVFAAGGTLQLDNFKSLRGFGWPGFRRKRGWRQEKGQAECVAAFYEAICKGAPSPIVPEEIFEVAQATLEVADILRAQR